MFVVNLREIVPIHTLGFEHDDRAKHILKSVLAYVRPVMKNHDFEVGNLDEFFPKDANLLGMNTNGGELIQIRLRPASNKNVFLPIDCIIGTMLHELCHNRISPHNKAFKALYETLCVECEEHWLRAARVESFPGVARVLNCSDPLCQSGAANTTTSQRSFSGLGRCVTTNTRGMGTRPPQRTTGRTGDDEAGVPPAVMAAIAASSRLEKRQREDEREGVEFRSKPPVQTRSERKTEVKVTKPTVVAMLPPVPSNDGTNTDPIL
eukprot:PhF_6_TR4421/c0_g1_i1/m.5979